MHRIVRISAVVGAQSWPSPAAASLLPRPPRAQGVQRWLSWKAGARAAVLVRGGAGVAVIAGGLYFLYTAT